MSELAAKDYRSVPVPRRVKVSSKRQITIPVDIYERQGFAEYALLTETNGGLVVQPMRLVDDDEEKITVELLRYLIDQGCEGEDLLERYEELKPKFASYYKAVKGSETAIAEGRLGDFDEMQERIRAKHGL